MGRNPFSGLPSRVNVINNFYLYDEKTDAKIAKNSKKAIRKIRKKLASLK